MKPHPKVSLLASQILSYIELDTPLDREIAVYLANDMIHYQESLGSACRRNHLDLIEREKAYKKRGKGDIFQKYYQELLMRVFMWLDRIRSTHLLSDYPLCWSTVSPG